MIIKPLNNDGWDTFYSWAQHEGWTISFQEQRLFQNQWRPSFFSLWEHGCCCGFISAVIYKTSGWIGNLLVQPSKRGNGYGSMLFDFAMERLQKNRLERIWLTASIQGAPMYRKRGFMNVNQIVRWTGLGTGQQRNGPAATVAELIALDHCCWKETRRPLLTLLADDGIILREEKSMALLQPGPAFWQIGPWLDTQRDTQVARRLLAEMVKRTPTGTPLVVDIMESSGLDLLLYQHGFKTQGQNELMCKSREPVENLTGITALASLGSIG